MANWGTMQKMGHEEWAKPNPLTKFERAWINKLDDQVWGIPGGDPARTPEQHATIRIACHALWRAALDLAGKTLKGESSTRNREGAISWVFSGAGPDQWGSFAWVCGQMGLPPQRTRTMLAEWCALGCPMPARVPFGLHEDQSSRPPLALVN